MPRLAIALVTSIAVICALLGSDVQSEPHYQISRPEGPARTIVTDESGAWLATLTDGAYTVTLAAPHRVLSGPTTRYEVPVDTAVRVLGSPFGGTIDESELNRLIHSPEPDILDLAMAYVADAPPVYNTSGLQIAGQASYGPLKQSEDGRETSDFTDYLGIQWQYSDRKRDPRADRLLGMDCSGYMRMIWGYRSGLPLTWTPDGQSIPRHSWEILDSAPGIVLLPDNADRPADLSALAPGDLVFFDAKSVPGGSRIDHVGMYLGIDTGGHSRFISSRQHENGPTLGDAGGASILDGNGLYARAFRAARRL